MGMYLFEEGYFKSDFGRGAAISILMLVIVAAMSVFYVRRWSRSGRRVSMTRPRREARQSAWNALGARDLPS